MLGKPCASDTSNSDRFCRSPKCLTLLSHPVAVWRDHQRPPVTSTLVAGRPTQLSRSLSRSKPESRERVRDAQNNNDVLRLLRNTMAVPRAPGSSESPKTDTKSRFLLRN